MTIAPSRFRVRVHFVSLGGELVAVETARPQSPQGADRIWNRIVLARPVRGDVWHEEHELPELEPGARLLRQPPQPSLTRPTGARRVPAIRPRTNTRKKKSVTTKKREPRVRS